ncbi:hypothetical protein [Sphingobium ummariense]|uniref:Uncharacterized protein n=1 Tax=Sphingobium ummariense RL-3 TaxID=1346791 RepID=T0J237_9SPHN|nr:hypothetical protein [Sphingobium ummariense]EQB32021.1 hypothetical protein M529_11795 [Sphingobium ummariense RL-3]
MRRLIAKGLHALLTNPISGEPIGRGERVMLAISLVQALVVIVALVGGTLGLGAGR